MGGLDSFQARAELETVFASRVRKGEKAKRLSVISPDRFLFYDGLLVRMPSFFSNIIY